MKNNMKRKVVKHLKDDMQMFEREKAEDKKLVKKLKKADRVKKEEEIIADDMERFAKGKMHSGSKKGPVVKNPRQAIAISISVAKKKSSQRAGKKTK